jgi:hypothetical protein
MNKHIHELGVIDTQYTHFVHSSITTSPSWSILTKCLSSEYALLFGEYGPSALNMTAPWCSRIEPVQDQSRTSGGNFRLLDRGSLLAPSQKWS